MLFAEGRRLLASGDTSGACRKLAESRDLDPGLGTLLNLGDCSERLGKTATAWSVFRQAEMLARIGVAGLAAGGILSLRAASSWEKAQDRAASGSASDPASVQEARADTRLARVLMGAGAAGVAAGVILWLTSPPVHRRDASAGATLVPTAGSHGAGLQLTGAF